MAELLEMRGVSKVFPGVRALDGVDFTVRRGEIHALMGENGAGKSTLIKVLTGAEQRDGGEVRLDEEPIRPRSPKDAQRVGISTVYQEVNLVPNLSVAENLFLGAETTTRGLVNKRELHRRAQAILARLGFALRPEQLVGFLSRAEQQMVEIAKAFRSELSVLILDEPTASLTERETDQLFALIEQIKRDGVGVVYITHRIAEIRRIGP